MPRIFRAIGDEFNSGFNRKDVASGNGFVSFKSNGAVVLRDRRGTLKAKIPTFDACIYFSSSSSFCSQAEIGAASA
jgi:hypothetical protein